MSVTSFSPSSQNTNITFSLCSPLPGTVDETEISETPAGSEEVFSDPGGPETAAEGQPEQVQAQSDDGQQQQEGEDEDGGSGEGDDDLSEESQHISLVRNANN